MNILIVTPFDIHSTGGVSTSVKMLCREFTARGHRITVLTPGKGVFPQLSDHYGEAAIFRAYLRIPYVPEAPVLGMLAFVLVLANYALLAVAVSRAPAGPTSSRCNTHRRGICTSES